jgi:transcriptional regulator with XRE-family HTH domain
MDLLALEIGRALRRVRRVRGLTLRDVTARSRGRFKPTSVAGYERAERNITLENFCELCGLYDMAPSRLLADILRSAEGRSEPVLDLAMVETLHSAEAALVSGFLRQISTLRGEQQEETISVRAGDLEILAAASDRKPEELEEMLRPMPTPRRADEARKPIKSSPSR